jgi:23S rRNA (cytidine1920-2'-O)/16S rRNA (cytidine1409-2'-O)-methyltransferase
VRRPLDQELVRRGLADSPDAARHVIASGRVRVAGRPALKESTLVRRDEPVTLSPSEKRFVSRGGQKLSAALERFAVDVSGRNALDAGASTGGFTDCLLAAGASCVVAVDVGYGQLHWGLRQDPRVTVLERTNIRDVRREDLPFRPTVVTADLSFISLELVLPALARVAADRAEFVMLVKPQFEAPPADVEEGGVVRSTATRRLAIERVAFAARDLGIAPQGVLPSPLLGPAGNVEFLVYAVAGASPVELDVAAAVGEQRT